MKYLIFLFMIIGAVSITPIAFAHTTIDIAPYEIEVGWGTEPPVVGLRNDFVFAITQPGDNPGVKSGVINAFKNLEATARFGGITKTLDIDSDPRPGHYFSPVIPTRTGTITIDLKGDINGIPVDIQVPIEDVESTAVLDFPPTSSSSDQDLVALKNTVSSMQKEIAEIKSGSGITISSDGSSYDFAVFGLSLGAAGVILAIIAMVKRK